MSNNKILFIVSKFIVHKNRFNQISRRLQGRRKAVQCGVIPTSPARKHYTLKYKNNMIFAFKNYRLLDTKHSFGIVIYVDYSEDTDIFFFFNYIVCFKKKNMCVSFNQNQTTINFTRSYQNNFSRFFFRDYVTNAQKNISFFTF